MTSYRPKIKNDENGTVSDLALDAETVQGYKPCVNIVTLEDNGTTTAGTWLAKSDKISSLVDGQLYLYKITVAGASTTTLNITNSSGTALGAKTVYRTGTTKLTTQYAVGHYILLVYNSLNTAFRVINDYDANSYAYVRQYQHGDNAAGTTNLYPILTRYNLTNKNGTYDTAYSRFHTGTYINITNGYLYAPKVYSGGSEVALKTDIPAAVTESTVSGWGFTKNAGTITGITMNGSSKGTSGVIDLGTVITSAVTKLGTRTGDITIATLKSDLGLGSAAYTDSTAYATSSHTHSSLKNGNYTASLPTLTANATLALTSDIPSAVTEATVSGWGFTKNIGTVTKVNNTSPDSNGNVSITIPSAVTEATVSGWGFTKNAGTVTSVSAGPGLSISGTATITPKVYIDSGYKLPTNTEWTNNTFTGIITDNHVDLKTLQYDGVYLLRYGTWTYIHTYVNESSDSTVNNMDHPSGYTKKHSYGAGAISLLYFTKYHSGTAWHYEWRTLGFNDEFDYMGEFTTTTSGAINPGAWVKTIFTRPLSNGNYDINLPTLSSNETLAVTSDLGDQVTYSYSAAGGTLTITSK